jgi:hypothetical protein
MGTFNHTGDDSMNTQILTEMGIQHPEEITHFDFRQKSKNKDELIIHFKRRKGSLRAASRSYEYGRSLKTVITDSGRPEFEDTYELSPFAIKAMEELNKLLKITQPSRSSLKQMLMSEIADLEKLMEIEDKDGKVQDTLNKLREHVAKL